MQYSLVSVMASSSMLGDEENEENDIGKDCSWYAGLREFFEIVQDEGKNVKVCCRKCLPHKTVLSSSKQSAANLMKHMEVCCFLGHV